MPSRSASLQQLPLADAATSGRTYAAICLCRPRTHRKPLIGCTPARRVPCGDCREAQGHFDDTPLTGTGCLAGSPAYIAPERINGEPATEAADLWALGATFYTLAEGRPPFTRPDAVAVYGAILHRARAHALRPVIEALLTTVPRPAGSRRGGVSRMAPLSAALGTARRCSSPTDRLGRAGVRRVRSAGR
ncbi:hypothetical protein [Actinomadura sp. RB99]|uniref:protein kinase domain-containing protein n=1 Tax=Actinomadura sp. RB99 TaxID=2691577 RepID=UPI0016845B8F